MNAKQFAGEMKRLVIEVKSQGITAIDCDNLIAYLAEVENRAGTEPTAMDIEEYRAKVLDWVDANRHQRDGSIEMFRAVIHMAGNAIKTSFLLNGGAAVALLAFIGHLAQFRADLVPAFATRLLPFAVGVLLITCASGLAYLTQWMFASEFNVSWKRLRINGPIGQIVCVLVTIASYVAFGVGVFNLYGLFLEFK